MLGHGRRAPRGRPVVPVDAEQVARVGRVRGRRRRGPPGGGRDRRRVGQLRERRQDGPRLAEAADRPLVGRAVGRLRRSETPSSVAPSRRRGGARVDARIFETGTGAKFGPNSRVPSEGCPAKILSTAGSRIGPDGPRLQDGVARWTSSSTGGPSPSRSSPGTSLLELLRERLRPALDEGRLCARGIVRGVHGHRRRPPGRVLRPRRPAGRGRGGRDAGGTARGRPGRLGGGVRRDRRQAVRLLLAGDRHEGRGAAPPRARRHARGDRPGAGRQPVPLHRLHEGHRCDRGGRRRRGAARRRRTGSTGAGGGGVGARADRIGARAWPSASSSSSRT